MPESLIITTNTSGNKEGYCWLPKQRILLAYRDRAGSFTHYWQGNRLFKEESVPSTYDVQYDEGLGTETVGLFSTVNVRATSLTVQSQGEQKISVLGLAWTFLEKGLLFNGNPSPSCVLQLFVEVWREGTEEDHCGNAEKEFYVSSSC